MSVDGERERERGPGSVDVLGCHGRICFSTRTESERELWEDGFYFEVFPPIVHYCRELLLRRQRSVKRGSRVSPGRENRHKSSSYRYPPKKKKKSPNDPNKGKIKIVLKDLHTLYKSV